MSFNNLREQYCFVCKRRGDYVGKSNLRVVTEFMVSKLNEVALQVGQIICKKHLLTYIQRPLNETNQIEINNQNQKYNNNVNENEVLNDQTDVIKNETENSNISITAQTNESLKKRKIPVKKDSITLSFDRPKKHS